MTRPATTCSLLEGASKSLNAKSNTSKGNCIRLLAAGYSDSLRHVSRMERPVRRRTTGHDEVRGRILDAAEGHFRRLGHRKTSVADIASELGMSPANVYRFFPSSDAINKSICMRVVNVVVDIASAWLAARADSPPPPPNAMPATQIDCGCCSAPDLRQGISEKSGQFSDSDRAGVRLAS
jgi:hypothetical protein